MDIIEFISKNFENYFYVRMCSEQVELSDIKRFIAQMQVKKIMETHEKKLQKFESESYHSLTPRDFIEIGKLKTINTLFKTIDFNNLDDCISKVDACSIIEYGEENCDIIISKATEDELQIYIYQLMKQFEKENGPIEFGPQKRI